MIVPAEVPISRRHSNSRVGPRLSTPLQAHHKPHLSPTYRRLLEILTTPAHCVKISPVRLIYESGNEHDGFDRLGLVVLELASHGAARVRNRQDGGLIERTWETTVEPALVEQVLASLTAGGFPAVPDHEIAAGARLREIAVERAGGTLSTPPIEWDLALGMPGYGDAFRLLDSLVFEASQGTLRL